MPDWTVKVKAEAAGRRSVMSAEIKFKWPANTMVANFVYNNAFDFRVKLL